MWTDSARAKYGRPAKRYATDLTDAEFALVEPRLPPPCRLGRPRTDRSAGGAGRDLLPAAHRLPVGAAAQGLPTQEHGLRLFPALVAGRHAARPVLRPAGPGPAGCRPRRPADRRHRRQPVGQDDRKRRPARLRCRQEDQRPQAARAGRHTRPPAARHRSPRQRPGPRRARPAADAHPAPLPLARLCCSPTAAIRARSRPRRRATSGWRWPIVKRSDRATGFVVLPKRWVAV